MNKSPGADGYAVKWYKYVFDHLPPTLLKAFSWVIQSEDILPLSREVILSVIPKQRKDKMECGSYQPISVLNVDYKLLTYSSTKTGNSSSRSH